MWTVALLLIANIFMTFAWYGHLKHHTSSPLAWTVLTSWGIAFFEYCFQVPANRWGQLHYKFTAVELKTMQEVITLVVFGAFSVWYLGERLRWNHVVGFTLLILAVWFVFTKWD